MLDRKFIVEDASLVQENARRRVVSVDVSRFVELDRQRRALETKLQELQKLVNEVSAGGAMARSAVDREALIQRGRELREARDDAANHRDDLVREMTGMQLQIPNLTHPDVPVGGESANVVVRTGAHPPRDFGFQPKDHLDLGQALDLVDFEAGSRLAGHGFSHPDRSNAELERLRDIECRIFDELEIPYRVVDIASGDLGAPAYRKYDLEAWMPGRDAYGEVTSTSNCTDYRARRLNIRFKPSDGRQAHFVHTLNGTAIANSRAIVSLLENHRQRDGSVVIPASLRPYTGFDVIPALGRR